MILGWRGQESATDEEGRRIEARGAGRGKRVAIRSHADNNYSDMDLRNWLRVKWPLGAIFCMA
jgi:hypothetical protein